MIKFFGLLFSTFFLFFPSCYAQDGDHSSSDSGVLVSSPDQTQGVDQDSLVNHGNNDTSNGSAQVNSIPEQPASNSASSPSSDSTTDPIILKSTDAVMFQITHNITLPEDQINAVRQIVEDYEIKLRSLQLSLQSGAIDSKSMYSQRQQLMMDEDRQLSSIFTSDQMKIWINIQDR